jgi:putative MATE family efflux protein
MAAGILRAFGDSKRPLYVLALCALVNLMGDLLLVGGLGLGVEGAALATVFSQMVSVVCTFYLLSGTVPAVEQGPVWRPGFYRGQMAAMVKIGFPLALQSILFPVANSIVQASVNQMGTDQIAAWSICEKLDLLIWLIADTMGPALTTYTAQNLGAGKPERVKKGVRMGTGMSILAVAVVSLILYFGSPVMGHWFVSAEDGTVLVPLVSRYLRMMAPFFVFYALAEALSGACCGMGDTVGPMATTLVSVCLLRVVCIWLVLPRFGTMECIVWIYIASWLAAGFAFSGLYLWRVRGGNGPGVA